MNLLHGKHEGITEKILHQDNSHYLQYLRFTIDNEVYAVDVINVREIINYIEPTEVPNAGPYVKGVISLRGTIIPVIAFSRYHNPPYSDSHPQHGKKKNIIIIGHKNLAAGLPVDRVREVIYVTEDKFSPVPQFVEKEKVEFYKGIIEYKDLFIMALKTETLLAYLKNKN
ncbi:MAG: purine-binding chemotaxis protein CheW [Nitrospirae bacterium]|nr:purine-binding chemotaxis protein CheW [Nitrospirota bacterium]